ncbi:Plug and carboxypeptidase regulatory-like domain-containing protein [Parabacteroides sp. OttesenSCG-928-G07]|nr:Plug and carboxypeptidase regulatory-like domain-containing protein [Parabacteroides sp. OttesenSCG-928-G21]MDL2277893.1 Plug and carboxypeptidase regulatory-like domain-containing protein [Parabacteroides sp. OttesenSCG-928-G07]
MKALLKAIAITLLTVLIVDANPLSAQNKQEKFNVSGTVADATGNPLSNIQVSVLYTRISAKTNKKGEFTLKKVQANDSIRVIIDKVDYAQFLMGNHTKVNLAIVENMLNVTFENGDVAFSAIKLLPDDEDFRYGSIITNKMIERNNFRTLEEIILNMIPGATIINNGAGVRLRSGKTSIFATEGALIIIDGTEMTYTDANAILNATNIETVEVDKEGASYGARGVNGAIKITTNQ